MDEIVAVWQPVRAGLIDRAHRLRRAITRAPRRARALAVAVVAAACSAWSLLPDVNDVLTDWSGALSGSTTGLLTGAFSGQLGSISAGEWNIATAMTGKLGMVMGVVAVALCGVQVIAAIVAGDHARLGYAALWALIAWPATATAVWLIVKVTAAIDALAIGMLSTSGSAQDIALVFTMLLANAGNQPFMLVVWAVLLWLPSLVLSLVMAFRNYSLLLLVGFAPAAVMSQGWRALRPVVTKWAQAVVALILAKVFAAGILVLAMDLVTGSPDLGALITGMVGLWMACMSPAASMAVMGWAGGQLADAGASRVTSRAGQAAAAPLRSAGQTATSRLVDQATHRVRESMKARATASKPVDNPAPATGTNSNDPGQQPTGTPGQSAGGAGAKATSGAGAPAGAAGASGAAGGAGAGAGGAAAGGAAAGASAGAAAGPVGAAVGAGAGLVKSGIDKVRSAVAGAAAQGTPDASSGQDTSAGRGGAGESGDRLRSAVAAMSGANDHLLTAPGSSGPSAGGSSGMAGAPGTAGSAGASGVAAGSVVTARTAPGGPGGGSGGGSTAERGGAQGAAGSNQPGPDAPAADTGASRPRTAPGGGSVRRPSGPGSSSGGQSGPSLFGGR
ncbi:hypothetical protein [Cellulomonas sp. ES6]|uniref:hypothetical protein n=1 Tax=Cellulomonas sp. ES6 TaxID=3039384 RepID=UPI0024B72E16|nr:hypothetical protein [Cellulomonas sp. ES6]WHP16600.1 hypothetical protein P9841_13375 [Cellulomonas sp. ES6]